MTDDEYKLSRVPVYSNPYEKPTSMYFQASERVIEYRTSYTCIQCHRTLSKLMDKSGDTIWYCSNCNLKLSEEELPKEIYSEKHEVSPPPPIPGFQSGVRIIGGK